MSQVIHINLRPDVRTLRQFGWIATAAFSLLALCAWAEWLMFAFGLGAAKASVAGALLSLALLCSLFSAIWPRANRPLYVGLTLAAFPIGFVLSYVIMGALFYLLIAPTGLLLRLLGRDLMGRNRTPGADTYWVTSRPARPEASYFRQF